MSPHISRLDKALLIGHFTPSWQVQPNFPHIPDSRGTFLKPRELTMSSNSLKIFQGSSMPPQEKRSHFNGFFMLHPQPISSATSPTNFARTLLLHGCGKRAASHTYHVLCAHRFTYLRFSAQALSTRLIASVLFRSMRTVVLHPSGIALLILCCEYTPCALMSYLH